MSLLGALRRTPHCEICAEHASPRDLLLPGQDYRDPLVADVLASGERPCVKRWRLERLAWRRQACQASRPPRRARRTYWDALRPGSSPRP